MSLSRIEELLEMINNKSGPTDMIPLSRTEEILKCYINGISYTGPITSRFEELLYNTLYKQPSDEQPLSRSEEILKSKINKTTYEGAILSRVEELLLELKTEPDPVEITIGPDTILHVLNAIEAAAVSLKIDLTPTQDGTPWISETLNTEPYLSRASQNGNTADETIVGGTVCFNQLVQNGNFSDGTNNWTITTPTITISASDNILTVEKSSSAYSNGAVQRGNTLANHVYLCTAEAKKVSGNNFQMRYMGLASYTIIDSETWMKADQIVKPNESGTDIFIVYIRYQSGTTGTANVKNVKIHDLTQKFGSTIADYIYSLEQATEGAGVAWLRSHGFIDDKYHAYNPGELISAKPTAKVVGDTTYALGGADLRGMFKLDANNNLYCDGDVYTSDGTITRKYGIVDLGSLNWVHDGGSVFRSNTLINSKLDGNSLCMKYTRVTSAWGNVTDGKYRVGNNAMRICDTNYSDATTFKTAMSGVYLVYELETPTTVQSTAYTNPQKAGEAESFVDARTEKVPVGHSTRYSAEYAINGFEGVTVHVSETQTGGTTYPVTFTSQGTVYGGTIDVVSGELKITWGYIASYNGETLPGVWMSSKEVYVEGTSPSLGAEVSYILSTSITATIDPTTINISEGESYVWAEEGDSTLTYMGIPVTRKRSK